MLTMFSIIGQEKSLNFMSLSQIAFYTAENSGGRRTPLAPTSNRVNYAHVFNDVKLFVVQG